MKETASVLRCSPSHVKKLVAAGTVPSVAVGRLRRVRREDLDSYIRDLTWQPTDPSVTTKQPMCQVIYMAARVTPSSALDWPASVGQAFR